MIVNRLRPVRYNGIEHVNHAVDILLFLQPTDLELYMYVTFSWLQQR